MKKTVNGKTRIRIISSSLEHFLPAMLGIICLLVFVNPARADTITYEYDALGRLKRVVYPTNQYTDYNLDPAGNRTSVVDVAGDPPPSFSVNDVSADEGDTLDFVVTKTGTTGASYAIDYSTSDGTAVAEGDYASDSDTLIFGPTVASLTVSVSTVLDAENLESTENMTLALANPSGGATITINSGLGTINNIDTNNPPTAYNDGTSVQVFQYKELDLVANDTDPDSDPLTIISVTQPPHANVIIVSPTTVGITGTSAGYDSFSYTISDGKGGTDSAGVIVNVTGGGGGRGS